MHGNFLYSAESMIVIEEGNETQRLENQWIQLAQAGDLSAFNQLVLKYQNMAFRMALQMLNDEPSAEDMVQKAFIAAYRAIGSFRSHSFRSWLLRILHNACIDELRQWERHPWLALEPQDADGEEMETASWLIDPGLSPEELLVQHESWRAIEQCLCQLPVQMREVIALIDIETLDYAAAAEILGIPMGTLKSRLGRARSRLRQILHDAYQEQSKAEGLLSKEPVKELAVYFIPRGNLPDPASGESE